MSERAREIPKPITRDDYLVIVCDVCRTASCWHGEHLCGAANRAGIVEVPASVLDTENREHPSNYSRDKLRQVYGKAPKPCQ